MLVFWICSLSRAQRGMVDTKSDCIRKSQIRKGSSKVESDHRRCTVSELDMLSLSSGSKMYISQDSYLFYMKSCLNFLFITLTSFDTCIHL